MNTIANKILSKKQLNKSASILGFQSFTIQETTFQEMIHCIVFHFPAHVSMFNKTSSTYFWPCSELKYVRC